MKKQPIYLLFLAGALFAGITLGFFLGRNLTRGDVIVSLPESMYTEPTQVSTAASVETTGAEEVSFPLDINQADSETLQALPGIGEVLAGRIIAYRDENGPFSSPDQLMNVEGIGEKRLEAILDYITIGG